MVPSTTGSQAQAHVGIVLPPHAPTPQPISAAVSGQPASDQEADVPSTSHTSRQHGNSLQQAAHDPGQHLSQALSERGHLQSSMKASGSQQPQPPSVQPQPPLVGKIPDLLPQVPQVTVDFAPATAPAPGNVHVQPSAPGNVQGLTMQIKQMKNEMIHYASLLGNPVWKQQQRDGGKAVRVYKLHQPQLVACWQCHVLQPVY